MADHVALKHSLRHPAEIPTFVIMVILNVVILGISQLIPVLGPTLSRLREYSCDRNGAALEPAGEPGLILLAAGRYAADNVRPSELVEQGRHLGGFWVGISQLPRSHPWTVRRIWRLHRLSLFGGAGTVDKAPRPLDVA
jgi:Zn-dependent protease with chaperone function